MNHLVLHLHVLAGCLLAGGSLYQALVVVPLAARAGDARAALPSARRFFLWSAPALLVQTITGPMLAAVWLPDPAQWLPTQGALGAHVFAKIFCLGALAALFLSARLLLAPRVADGRWGMRALRLHAGMQALLAVCFVVLGVSIRLGG